MNQHVIYRQLNKDYAYWTEKRRLGQLRGGQVSGLLTCYEDEIAKQNLLFDVGLGTLEAIADFCPDSFWDETLSIFITHGHIDHHAELMILSEIYCQRRGSHLYDIRPPLTVYCSEETQQHLFNTHRYSYTGGQTLVWSPIKPAQSVQLDPFVVTPIAVDHFAGAVIYTIEFHLNHPHKILIGWDLTTPPMSKVDLAQLRQPSLALIEATTWAAMGKETGHCGIEALVQSGFLAQLRLQFDSQQEQYGAYFVHYSGWEDVDGMLTDRQLKEKFDSTYPEFANLVRVAERGQQWKFR